MDKSARYKVITLVIAASVVVALMCFRRFSHSAANDDVGVARIHQDSLVSIYTAEEGNLETQSSRIVAEEEPEHSTLRLQLLWKEDSTPATGIEVQLTRGDNSINERAVTNFSGGIEWSSIVPGAYILQLDRAESIKVSIRRGESQDLVHLLPRGVDVVGIVLDRDGVPVINADIYVYDGTVGTAPFRIMVSDLSGKFYFRNMSSGRYVGAHKDCAQTSSLVAAVPEMAIRKEVSLILKLDASCGGIRGVVTDHSGHPIESAKILIGSALADSRTKATPGAVASRLRGTPGTVINTTDDGVFAAECVSPGIIPIEITAEGYAPVVDSVITSECALTDCRIVLNRGAIIVGTVNDALANGVSNAKVIYKGAGFHNHSVTSTSSDGSFRMFNCPLGDGEVQIIPKDMPRAKYPVQLIREEEYIMHFKLPESCMVSGQVYGLWDNTGFEWTITARIDKGSPGDVSEAPIDREGGFTLPVLYETEYSLEVSRRDDVFSVAEIHGISCTNEDIVIHVDKGRNTGGLCGIIDKGLEMQAYHIILDGVLTPGIESYSDPETGLFRFDGLPPDEYRLIIDVPDSNDLWLGPYPVLSDHENNVGLISVHGRGSLTVRCETTDGREIRDVRVILLDLDQAFVGELARRREGFEIHNVRVDKYLVYATAEGYADELRFVELSSREQREILVLQNGTIVPVEINTTDCADWKEFSCTVQSSSGVEFTKRVGFRLGLDMSSLRFTFALRSGNYIIKGRTDNECETEEYFLHLMNNESKPVHLRIK